MNNGEDNTGHLPVLLNEALEGLAVMEDGVYIDGTYGRGGHSSAILHKLGDGGQLLALDRDPDAVTNGAARFADDDRFAIEQRSFAMMANAVTTRGWDGQVNGILLDLGVSSPQLDDAERGFSFLRDGPLDMRMDPSQGESAADWLAYAKEQEIARVLREYGEERFSRRIARAIVEQRRQTPLLTTTALANLIEQAVPRREPGKHPATRSFQAIRIHINGELDQLKQVLPQCLQALAPQGRLAVISFHSLEDRIVKRFMRDHSRPPVIPREIPITASEYQAPLRLISKALRAGEAELATNPRARSAVLRVAERQQ